MTTLDPSPPAEPALSPIEAAIERRPPSGAAALVCACLSVLCLGVGYYSLVLLRRQELLQRITVVVFPILMLGLAVVSLVLWWRRLRAERADPSLERSRAARAGAVLAGLSLLAWPLVGYYAVLIFLFIGFRC